MCLRVFLSCLFDLGRGEQVPIVTRAPIERRIVSGGQISVTFECVFMTQGITVLSAYCHTLAMKTFLLYIFMSGVLWESGTKCEEHKPSLHSFFV